MSVQKFRKDLVTATMGVIGYCAFKALQYRKVKRNRKMEYRMMYQRLSALILHGCYLVLTNYATDGGWLVRDGLPANVDEEHYIIVGPSKVGPICR